MSRNLRTTFPSLLLALIAGGCGLLDPQPDAPPERADTHSAASGSTEWVWVPVPGSQCRSGSETGYAIRYGATDSLHIQLSGGGLCFNESTCAPDNLYQYGQPEHDVFALDVGLSGIFDPSRAENPFQGWTQVWVPYCTGDFHAGDRDSVVIAGWESLGPQVFRGRRNFSLYLNDLGPVLTDASRVVLAGGSAGGYGTVNGVAQVLRKAPGVPVTVLNDSGPLIPDTTVFSQRLQGEWCEVWGLAGCALKGPAGARRSARLGRALPYVGERFPEVQFAFLSFDEDETIRKILRSHLPPPGVDPCPEGERCPLPLGLLSGGIDLLATQAPANMVMYVEPGVQHGFLLKDWFYTASSDGVVLTDWLRDLLDGQAGDIGVNG